MERDNEKTKRQNSENQIYSLCDLCRLKLRQLCKQNLTYTEINNTKYNANICSYVLLVDDEHTTVISEC